MQLDKYESVEAFVEAVRENDPTEPMFVLRARDVFSLPTIDNWLLLAVVGGMSKARQENVHKTIKDFHEWRDNNIHKMRYPGTEVKE